METVKCEKVETFEVECPKCHDYFDIDVDNFEFNKDKKQVQTVECDYCPHIFIVMHPDY
jgi:hypothetical protein